MKANRDWITRWLEYTGHYPTPPLLSKWMGIGAIGGAMERKVWVRTITDLYPSFYIFLVAPPGTGKSLIMNDLERMFHTYLKEHHMSANDVTRASLMDEMHEANRNVIDITGNNPHMSFNSLYAVVDELQFFMSAYDPHFIAALVKMYDGSRIEEHKRGSGAGRQPIESPLFSLTAGTQPAHLQRMLPIEAWDTGFMARVICIFTPVQQEWDMFSDAEADDAAFKSLGKDLAEIGKMRGKMEFNKETVEAFREWIRGGCEPVPTNPRLTHYNTRRRMNIAKLSMVACAANGGGMTITVEHFNMALGWIIEAEHEMESMFKSMVSGGDVQIMNDAWHYMYKENLRTGKPIDGKDLRRFLISKGPAATVEGMITSMNKAGLIKCEGVDDWLPKGKPIQ